MTDPKNETSRFAQMGMAALIPGMQHILDLMQEELDRMRYALADAQGKNVRGRPRKDESERSPNTHAKTALPPKPGMKNGWPIDPEERSAEMKRRLQVAREKKAELAHLHPNDLRHPDHEKYRKNLSRKLKLAWAKKSPAEKKAQLERINNAKARAKAMKTRKAAAIKTNSHAAVEAIQ